MTIEVKTTCPFGSECEVVIDNTIHRCKLYIMIKGKDAQGDEHDDWNCSFAWQPIIQLETARKTNEVGAGVESLRNENTKRQNTALQSIRLINDLQSVQPPIKGIIQDGD